MTAAPGYPGATPYPVASGPYGTFPGENEAISAGGLANGVGGFPVSQVLAQGQPTVYPAANTYPTADINNPVVPNMGTNAGGVYPLGHILAGQPIMSQAGAARIVPTPMGMPNAGIPNISAVAGLPGPASMPQAAIPGTIRAGLTPYRAGQELNQQAAPASFSRPVNVSMPLQPFPDFMVTPLDALLNGHRPGFPMYLVSRDVFAEEWDRLMAVGCLNC